MAQKLSISIVIPSWNSLDQLKQNLPSVFAAAEAVKADITIVDDASTDHTTLKYLKSLGSKISLLENETNLGFARTVNRGVESVKGDLVVLLNTDVRPSKDCFKNATAYFGDSSVYAVGFNSGEGCMGGKWNRGLMEHFKATPISTSMPSPNLWASGGQAIFSRAKWLSLGGMDPIFAPFYWEDTDMGYRAWKRGWQVLWAPDCSCIHDHKSSVISASFTGSYISQVAQRNQFLFVWKNISDPAYLLDHFLHLPRYIYSYPEALFAAAQALPESLKSRRSEKVFWKKSDRDILKTWAR